MSRNPQQQRLIAIIEPVLQQGGYELVDLRFLLEQGGWVLRVCVDKPLAQHADLSTVPEERVDLSACAAISLELSAVLDVDDPITQAYSLEISSPGIDRPLRTAAHFAHFTGSEAKIQLAVPLQIEGASERRNFRGILQGADGDHVSILCDGTVSRLAIADIDQAKLVPDWDEVMKGRSGIGKPAPKGKKPGQRPGKHSTKEQG